MLHSSVVEPKTKYCTLTCVNQWLNDIVQYGTPIFWGPDESGRSLRKQTILRDESRRSFEPKRTIFWLKADDLMKADDPILDVVLTKSRRSWSKRTIFFHWHYESGRSYFWWIFDSKQTILTHAFWYESGRSYFWWIFDSKQTILTHTFWYESGRSFGAS